MSQCFVERLPLDDPGVVDLILVIKQAFHQKNVQKAIKKTIFRLKQRGMTIPDSESDKDAPILVRKDIKDESSAYLSHIDGSGTRGVFLTFPQVPKGVDLGMGVVNDEQGIIQFLYGRYSKKRIKEIKERFLSNFKIIVETSLSHAATILERAYTQNEGGLTELSKGYLQLRPWLLENVSLMEGAAIYDLIPSQSISSKTLTHSQIHKLLEHDLMSSWIVDTEKMKNLMGALQKTKESPILVSEVQRAEQIKEVKRKALSEIYPEEKRRLLKGRLEEMAYIFFKLNEEEMARLSLTAAICSEEKDSIFDVNPFLEELLERSLNYYSSLMGQKTIQGIEKCSPSLIIEP